MLGNIRLPSGRFLEEFTMGKFISRRNPVSAASLKRQPIGTVVRHHNSTWEDVEFTRVSGGWRRTRTDVTSERPEVVSSAAVADECNKAFGCKDSWAEIY